MPALLTVVETPQFLRDPEGVLSDDEKENLKTFVAARPEAGVVIPGTGGVRKLRWRVEGKGKRGGGRAIYYFYDLEMPLFLIAFFTKWVRSDLSAREKRASRQLADLLVQQFHPRS